MPIQICRFDCIPFRSNLQIQSLHTWCKAASFFLKKESLWCQAFFSFHHLKKLSGNLRWFICRREDKSIQQFCLTFQHRYFFSGLYTYLVVSLFINITITQLIILKASFSVTTWNTFFLHFKCLFCFVFLICKWWF